MVLREPFSSVNTGISSSGTVLFPTSQLGPFVLIPLVTILLQPALFVRGSFIFISARRVLIFCLWKRTTSTAVFGS